MNKDLMHRHNLRIVLDEIYRQPGISRSALARETGLTPMSTGRLADAWIRTGLVAETEMTDEVAAGRPPRCLSVARMSRYSLCAAVGQQGVRVGLIDPYGGVLGDAFTAFPSRAAYPEARLHLVGRALRDLDGAYTAKKLGVTGISVVDPGWQELDVRATIAPYLPGVPIAVESEIRARTLAEARFGVLTGHKDAAVLQIDQTVSAGILLEGSLYYGQGYAAGDIGHVAVAPDGPVCECGRLGCLQTVLSAPALLRMARGALPGITLAELFEQYAKGAATARAVIDRTVHYAGLAIDLLAHAYAPSAIVLCGHLVEAYPAFMERIDTYYAGEAWAHKPLLVQSAMGERGALLGASAVAFERAVEIMLDTM